LTVSRQTDRLMGNVHTERMMNVGVEWSDVLLVSVIVSLN